MPGLAGDYDAGAAAGYHLAEGVEDVCGADQVDGDDGLGGACAGDSPAVWTTCSTDPSPAAVSGGPVTDAASETSTWAVSEA